VGKIPALPAYIEVPALLETTEMSCQTEGPACGGCGAAFGCGGNCPYARNQLLGLRDTFLGVKLMQKEEGSLKAKSSHQTDARMKAVAGGA